jgi:hypothetical protein
MENRYGIGINNRYALFLDEEGEETNHEDLLLMSQKANTKGDPNKVVQPAPVVPAANKGSKDATATGARNERGPNKDNKGREQNKNRDGEYNRKREGEGRTWTCAITEGKLSEKKGRIETTKAISLDNLFDHS